MAQPVVSSWAGFYLGGNAELAINDLRFHINPSGCFLSSGSNNCGARGTAANPNPLFLQPFCAINFSGALNLDTIGSCHHSRWPVSKPISITTIPNEVNGTVALTGHSPCISDLQHNAALTVLAGPWPRRYSAGQRLVDLCDRGLAFASVSSSMRSLRAVLLRESFAICQFHTPIWMTAVARRKANRPKLYYKG